MLLPVCCFTISLWKTTIITYLSTACAEPTPSRVDVERPFPLVEAQLERVRTRYHARETQQHIDAAQLGHGVRDGLLNALFIPHVDRFGDNLGGREAGNEFPESAPSGRTSQSETPDVSCSRSARAAANPTLPVTVQVERVCGASDGDR